MAKSLFSFGTKFIDSLAVLPKDVHVKFVKSLELLSRNPRHPSLNVEPLQGQAKGLYSARVDLQYRLVFAQPSQEDVRLLFIGTHDEAYRFTNGRTSRVLEEIRSAGTPVESDSLETFFALSSVKTKKYLPLSRHLMNQPGSVSRLEMTFGEIECVIGDKLPPSAHKFPAWWANDHTRHVQASAWLGVGWKTVEVRLARGRLFFARGAKAMNVVTQ